MRPLSFSPSTVLGILLSGMAWSSTQATTCISLGNGNWNSPSTWSCGHVPAGGDTVIVLFGDTVTVSQNHVYNGPPLQIQIYGVWFFSGGGSKITLPCGSHVEIMVGGRLIPNSNSGGHSETVRICGVTYWYFDEGPQSGYQIWPPNVLPIELVSFEGAVMGGSALFQWITASETNSSHFELLRSRDGEERELVTSIAAQGNSNSTTFYAYLDVPGAEGVWYYTLVEEDLDAQRREYGTVAVLLRSAKEGLDCVPNPVIDSHLMISSGEPLTGAEVHIVAAGHPGGQRPQVLWEEERLLMVDISGLSPGLYIAQVLKGNGRSGHCTFVVQ